jgi:regulation of enolase protein 1 (concanavalin A-like superfamily)
MMKHSIKKILRRDRLREATSWAFVIIVMLTVVMAVVFSHASATTGGKMTLYFHKEASDVNETYNALSLTPPEPAADTAPGTLTSATNVNATPPTSFCESGDGQTDAQNERVASAASTGNRCLGTFISMPIGNAISIGTGDTSAITSQLWSSESASQAAVALNVYLYRCSTTCISTTTLTSTDRIATLTCAEPGTSATTCTVTATPANNITFVATDRIIAIVSSNVTTLRSGASTAFYFDSSARTAASVTLKYTALGYNTTNKPALTGSLDDDFTTAAATTACTTGGVAYGTNWTCLQGSAANTAGAFNAEDTAAAGSGDSSSWLRLSNQTTTTAAVPANFGTTPSNTFLYQTMPASYGDGSITTVVNSTATFGVGATTPTTPFNHIGLVLWTSNTDYLELQEYSTAATTGTNSVSVALNNSGTIGTAVSLNASTTSGIFGEVWLRMTNTAGSWQAQYSTDGTTWNNVGSAVVHTTVFTRVGLNAFAKIANPVSTYAGAFEWFEYNLASPTYNQTSFEFFDNADSTTPGTAHGNNTNYTLSSTGQQFRLRQLVKINGQVGTSGQSFNEQYADLSSYGVCSSIPSGNWANMSAGSPSNTPDTIAPSGSNLVAGFSAAWTNPGNITANDSVVATVTVTTTNSDWLVANNFGFSIPSGSTIDGIVATVNASANTSSSAVDNGAFLIHANSSFSPSNQATNSALPTTLTDKTYGGSSSTWGDSWTATDINSANFGFAFRVGGFTNPSTANVDYIKIQVYYTSPSTPILYYNNPTPSSGANISSSGSDPTDSGQTVNPQTYQEADGFTNSQSSIGLAVDGEWDLSLYDNSAPAGTTYCLRTVDSSNTALSTYTSYPMITTFGSAGPTMDQIMRGGEWFSSGIKQPFFWAN